MEYTEFRKILEDTVLGILGENWKIEKINVIKENGKVKEGMIFCGEIEELLHVVVYPEELYRQYQRGKTLEECVMEALFLYGEEQQKKAALEFGEKAMNWEECKEMVYPVLVSYAENQNMLKKMIHEPYFDLAVCYRICMKNGRFGSMSIRVEKKLLKWWGITESELKQQAFENVKNDGYHLEDIKDALGEDCIKRILKALGLQIKICDMEEMMILTNHRKLFGAIGMLDLDILAEYAEQKQNNLYILPSSVHEVIIMADDGVMTMKDVNEMVQAVNKEEVKLEEQLANHAYYFDREKREVRIAG